MRCRILAVFLFICAVLPVDAETPQTAWAAVQRAVVINTAHSEHLRADQLYGQPDDRPAAQQMEQSLRIAASGGVADAQLMYGLLLAGLPRLASHDLPVFFIPLDRVEYPYYPQPPGPVDTVEALRLLHLVADRADAPEADRALARLGLAQMNAALGADLGDGGQYYAAHVDALLKPDPTDGLGAAVLLTAAGRCAEARPRIEHIAAKENRPDPAVDLLHGLCADTTPIIAEQCLDQDRELELTGVMRAIHPLAYDDSHAAQIRVAEFSDVAACLWMTVARLSDDASASLPEKVRAARDGAATDAIGWPTNATQRTFMADRGDALRATNPQEAIRLLARGDARARLMAAQMLVDGNGITPDGHRARVVLRSASALPEAIPDTEILLAQLEFRGVGGPMDRPAALRRLMHTSGSAAHEALQVAYAALPWRLSFIDGSGDPP